MKHYILILTQHLLAWTIGICYYYSLGKITKINCMLKYNVSMKIIITLRF